MKLKTTAEHLVSLLAAHGVEYLFLNPGTDTAPVQEAVYSLAEAGQPAPKVLLSTFESVSLAAAHAYWKMTGRPQAIFVHVDAGTQNLGAQVHNVLRDRAGVIVIAGKTPYGQEADVPGARNAPIQWQQDVPDQPGIIRGYAKWIQEITRPEMLDRAIGRAVQVAASSPAGLAYLTVSRDVLMDPPRLDHSRVAGFPVSVPPAPAPDAVARIAAALAAAATPVLVTSRAGRTAEGFAAVEALADLAGLPVTGRLEGGPVNISSRHPANVAGRAEGAAVISAADVILVVESDVPWLPAAVTLREGVQVFHVDPDPAKASMPLWSYPVDVAVQADGPAALAAIVAELGRIAESQPTVAQRLADRSARLRERTQAPAERADSGPLTPFGVMAALSEVIDAEDIVIEEAVTNAEAVYKGLERTRQGTLTGPAAPGLGWALGGSLGVKLARPDRRVIAITGDGSFLFGVPTSALMMAAEWGTPFLAVILNNGGYRASRLPVYGLFPDGVSAQRRTVVGTRFTRAPDYPALAAACHAHGERVEKAEDLVPALRRALAVVDGGQAAVIECVVEQD
ncbi:MAG TPA: thiamine pyrophosphate-requiring protein [Actinocrinis sp.]|nr:thiamine pyrophosphate-requiring protein [Actinocrinis sp.]